MADDRSSQAVRAACPAGLARRRARRLLGVLATALAAGAGCRTMPGAGMPVPLSETQDVRQRLEASQPMRYQARNAVLVAFKPHWWWPAIRSTALGYMQVDRAASSYAVVCLTPVGVKLFDIARTNGQVQASFLVASMPHREAVVRAMGDDIDRMLFDLVPPLDAACRREGTDLVFRQTGTNTVVEYVVALPECRLVEKRCDQDGHRVCTIRYRDYRPVDGRSFPGEIVLHNPRHGFRLTLRLKEAQNE